MGNESPGQVQCFPWEGKEGRGWKLINKSPLELDTWLFVKTLDNKPKHANINHLRVKLGSEGEAARSPASRRPLTLTKEMWTRQGMKVRNQRRETPTHTPATKAPKSHVEGTYRRTTSAWTL